MPEHSQIDGMPALLDGGPHALLEYGMSVDFVARSLRRIVGDEVPSIHVDLKNSQNIPMVSCQVIGGTQVSLKSKTNTSFAGHLSRLVFLTMPLRIFWKSINSLPLLAPTRITSAHLFQNTTQTINAVIGSM
eukprot:3054086-Amphidinium_carterae.1